MSHNEDYLNRRHERREAARKKREAEAKRVRRTLFAAVLALAVCGVAFYNLTKDVLPAKPEKDKTQVQEAATEAPEEVTKPTKPVQKDPITTIHIKAAGDLNVTDSVVNAGVAIGGFDYGPVFKDVAGILSDADLTVMNFEGNVCGEPYGTATTSAPVELIRSLRSCGVDLLQMANSCAINNGLNGLTATLNAIRGAGIEPLGAYATASELRTSKGYTMTDVQGIKVAFVAFTKGLGGRGMPAGNENLVNLLYKDYATEYKEIDRDRITEILNNVATEKPDLTIALLHWGSEYNDDISKTQKSIVSLMQKLGVDVIIGTHPHTLQPIVFDETAGTLVAYSLGDFFGEADRGATNYSIILDLEITKDANAGITRVTDFSYTPIYTVREGEAVGNRDRRVVRIEKALEAYEDNFLDKVTESTAAGMEKAMTRIPQRMATELEVTCPECDKAVTVQVVTDEAKKKILVSDKKCKCGYILEAGKSASDFK
ncbi:MAG: CapA family protein [Oscillospiraceae bacterium]|nr:CapA family protein [Oscillospiraceae bacterium]